MADSSNRPEPALNVLGGLLQCCCTDPVTGFYRDGHCHTGPQDVGRHLVCARVTAEFLEFSRAVHNDLSTPRPEFDFPGLKPGDRWCLCAARWQQAANAGKAPPVILAATHSGALAYCDREQLFAHGIDRPAPSGA